MWFERFVIIQISCNVTFYHQAGSMFSIQPGLTWSVFIGSIAFIFYHVPVLFIRVLPSIAMAEVKLILKSSSEQAKIVKRILDHGDHLDEEQVEFYKESLTTVFDSVEMA